MGRKRKTLMLLHFSDKLSVSLHAQSSRHPWRYLPAWKAGLVSGSNTFEDHFLQVLVKPLCSCTEGLLVCSKQIGY